MQTQTLLEADARMAAEMRCHLLGQYKRTGTSSSATCVCGMTVSVTMGSMKHRQASYFDGDAVTKPCPRKATNYLHHPQAELKPKR